MNTDRTCQRAPIAGLARATGRKLSNVRRAAVAAAVTAALTIGLGVVATPPASAEIVNTARTTITDTKYNATHCVQTTTFYLSGPHNELLLEQKILNDGNGRKVGDNKIATKVTGNEMTVEHWFYYASGKSQCRPPNNAASSSSRYDRLPEWAKEVVGDTAESVVYLFATFALSLAAITLFGTPVFLANLGKIACFGAAVGGALGIAANDKLIGVTSRTALIAASVAGAIGGCGVGALFHKYPSRWAYLAMRDTAYRWWVALNPFGGGGFIGMAFGGIWAANVAAGVQRGAHVV